MGDVIHVIPAVKNVRREFPSAHIAWLVEDKLDDLIEGLPEIDEVIVFPRRQWQKYLKSPRNYFRALSSMRLFVKKLRKRKYDIALDFHGNAKSGLLAYLSGARLRVGFSRGYCKEFNFLFTNIRIRPRQKRMHRIDKYLSLLDGLGIQAYYHKPVFSIPDADRLYIDDFLCHNHLDQKSLAIIHPGTSMFGKYKRWPAENYARLADVLTKKFQYSVVFTWGASEYNLVEKILSFMQYQATIACETSSVKQLITLLQRARLFIGGDTGPTHIASCLGIPTIAIFGPKDPAVYAPYGRNALVVRKDIPCSPCEKRECDHVACIHSVTPEDVVEAVRDIEKFKLEKKFDFLNTA